MITKEIEKISLNQAVLIDGKDFSVTFSAVLHSLVQRDGQEEWLKSGKSYKAITLGNFWIMSLPIKEGGKTNWFKLKIEEEGSTLGNFFLGSKEKPGPARKFARAKEQEKVEFEMFNQNWIITDIGTFDVEAEGSSDLIKDGDRLYYIVSIQNEDKIFLYLDARPKEAKGIGGSFIGEVFNPETEIESIL